jgi:hypothetical protein
MKSCSKIGVVLCLALGGCVADEPGLDNKQPGPEGDEPATASTEQALGLQTIYDIRGFGGNLFAENFYYATPTSCSPWYQRVETPTTRWSSQVGGFCAFQGWLTPSNPFDCRALILAHTAGGGFGGTCETFVTEEPASDSYTYATVNTNSAQANTVNRAIVLGAGQTLSIGTCGVTVSSFSGDTYLRLNGPAGTQVASNDDSCSGLGSHIVFTASSSGTYEIHAGCYSNTSCSGRVAWTIQ